MIYCSKCVIVFLLSQCKMNLFFVVGRFFSVNLRGEQWNWSEVVEREEHKATSIQLENACANREIGEYKCFEERMSELQICYGGVPWLKLACSVECVSWH